MFKMVGLLEYIIMKECKKDSGQHRVILLTSEVYVRFTVWVKLSILVRVIYHNLIHPPNFMQIVNVCTIYFVVQS